MKRNNLKMVQKLLKKIQNRKNCLIKGQKWPKLGFTNAKIDSKDQKEELQTQMYFKIVAYWYFQTVAVLMNVFATSLTISPAIPKLGK